MGLYLPMQGTKQKPALMFFLPQNHNQQISPSQLDETIRAQLEKQGITKEADLNEIVSKAEIAYEQKAKMLEAHKEVKRLMALREAGAKLMQVGFRKWKEVFYPAIRKGGE